MNTYHYEIEHYADDGTDWLVTLHADEHWISYDPVWQGPERIEVEWTIDEARPFDPSADGGLGDYGDPLNPYSLAIWCALYRQAVIDEAIDQEVAAAEARAER